MSEIDTLLSTVARLRDPDSGCPWDIEQTHQSITDCLFDECCELLQTIDRMDMEHMKKSWGMFCSSNLSRSNCSGKWAI